MNAEIMWERQQKVDKNESQAKPEQAKTEEEFIIPISSEVNVKRSSGKIDGGWKFEKFDMDTGEAVVTKHLEGNTIGEKKLSKFELYKQNTPEGKDFSMTGEEWLKEANKYLEPYGQQLRVRAQGEGKNFSSTEMQKILERATLMNISGETPKLLPEHFWKKVFTKENVPENILGNRKESDPNVKLNEIIKANPHINVPKFGAHNGKPFTPEQRLRIAEKYVSEYSRKQQEEKQKDELRKKIEQYGGEGSKEKEAKKPEWTKEDQKLLRMLIKGFSQKDDPELGLILIDLLEKGIQSLDASLKGTEILKNILADTELMYGTEEHKKKCDMEKYHKLQTEYKLI